MLTTRLARGRLPGLTWLDKRAMAALLTPAPPLARLVDAVVHHVLHPRHRHHSLHDGGEQGVASTRNRSRLELVCLHLRRGDFLVDCPKYAAEARSRQVSGRVLGEPR